MYGFNLHFVDILRFEEGRRREKITMWLVDILESAVRVRNLT